MNSQRILRHLVQITLMAGTMCLLPSVQAKSVAAVGALTPTTAPSQNLKRDVDELLRGVNGRLTPDVRPLLVAPGCPHCRPKPNTGQAQPSMQRDESFDPRPVLVAPDCGSGNCYWFRFFG